MLTVTLLAGSVILQDSPAPQPDPYSNQKVIELIEEAYSAGFIDGHQAEDEQQPTNESTITVPVN